MNSFTVGRTAEAAAAAYLEHHDFTVLAQNWRTRYCEIDIVARKSQTIYLIEVKYRRSDNYGDGLDYIMPAKLRRMEFAAQLWAANHNWRGDYQLAVVAVTGKDFNQLKWLLL